jgi:hypothetical protein
LYPEENLPMETFTGQKQTVIIPVLPMTGQKFPQHFDGYLENFALMRNVFTVITRFL